MDTELSTWEAKFVTQNQNDFARGYVVFLSVSKNHWLLGQTCSQKSPIYPSGSLDFSLISSFPQELISNFKFDDIKLPPPQMWLYLEQMLKSSYNRQVL